MDKLEQVAGYAEQALANDQWWYELGYKVGYEIGYAEARLAS